jgi:hypothetical protein
MKAISVTSHLAKHGILYLLSCSIVTLFSISSYFAISQSAHSGKKNTGIGVYNSPQTSLLYTSFLGSDLLSFYKNSPETVNTSASTSSLGKNLEVVQSACAKAVEIIKDAKK